MRVSLLNFLTKPFNIHFELSVTPHCYWQEKCAATVDCAVVRELMQSQFIYLVIHRRGLDYPEGLVGTCL